MQIESALLLKGYETTNLDYPSTFFRIEELADIYLHEAFQKLSHIKTLHIITHSMGGIMLRYYLGKYNAANIGRIVMLTPGHQGSPTIRLQMHNPLLRLLMGPSGVQSTDEEKCFACGLNSPIKRETGVIAGSFPLDPISWPIVKWPHDGKVTVSSTRLAGAKDHLVLPTSHDLVLFDSMAIFQSLHFLKNGNFLH